MSSENRRLILFVLFTFTTILGINYLMDVTGQNPRPNPPELAKIKKADGLAGLQEKEKAKEQGKEKQPGEPAERAAAKGEEKPQAPRKRVAPVEPFELVIGSAADQGPKGYHLELHLEQRGAGVLAVLSSQYEAEFDDQPPAAGQRPKPRHRPLKLLDDAFSRRTFPSLAITLPKLGKPGEVGSGAGTPGDVADRKDQDAELDQAASAVGISDRGEIPLDGELWEVVRDEQGRIARPIPAGARTEAEETGREIVFRTTVGQPEVIITKTYRLRKGADGFDLELRFESPVEERALVYKLFGPHGIPIEGEWYTGTFRDVVFGQIGQADIVTRSASDLNKKPELFQALPLKFAGIENQYFAVFVQPHPLPRTPDDRWDSESIATVVRPVPEDAYKADVTVEITSKPILVGPNVPQVHKYRVFAGPKTAEALADYNATELASFHKNQWFVIPGAAWMASVVITPLLGQMYTFTAYVARLFGGTHGNYGAAIILLTLTVRLLMFPIGRKQAMAAKKMQDLQPHMKELQEKYKDDREQLTRETWSLYKKHKVNPLGGCLPALLQLPIFVGLWQALNNSVKLRHASFLWIENLAAPDMLFRLPVTLPFLGDYFNVLPFLVVALMLVQTKLFSPPATTPEMEQQQKTMKFMMIIMAFMFYKVPSGLGIYFITSSLWQIGERLLLPKVTQAAPAVAGGGGGSGPGGGGGKKGGPGGGNGSPPKPPGRFAQFWEKILEEASKNPTYRNLTTGDQEAERDKGRDHGKPRARPGRRR
jgi:YidC/Oxa1 family membrane protein insertase